MPSILEYPDEPKYNIKSVSQAVNMEAVTIRAWESRYGLLTPKRADNGYRVYSERDIAVLQWVKNRTESGISISSAVLEFKQLITAGNWPEAVLNNNGPISTRSHEKPSVEGITGQFTQALLNHNEKEAEEVFESALGGFDLLALFEEVLAPILVDIGERWAKGQIKVATEQFASNFIQSRLQAIFQSLPLRSTAPAVMIGCAEEELHVIGPLMLSILLRDRGYRVEFLGADLPVDDLALYVAEETPAMLILSTTMTESAARLPALTRRLQKAKRPVLFGFGGAAFRYDPKMIKRIEGHYLGSALHDSVNTIVELLPLKQKKK
jgi:methanogenic corrinoid protein MtbC1